MALTAAMSSRTVSTVDLGGGDNNREQIESSLRLSEIIPSSTASVCVLSGGMES
jgi:hypothetical protein